MSVTPIGSNPHPTLAAELMQGLLPPGATSADRASTPTSDQALGDQLSLSPAALRLSQARATPAYLRDAMVTALMNGESQASDPASLLGLLSRPGAMSLFDTLGETSEPWGGPAV